MKNMDLCYDMLRLKNQLCFPLYACSREIVKKYKPFLDEFDLTYTQYITMMVMWERRQLSVKELGETIPEKMSRCVNNLTPEESDELYRLLYKLLGCGCPRDQAPAAMPDPSPVE